jgi:hypothetical protein
MKTNFLVLTELSSFLTLNLFYAISIYPSYICFQGDFSRDIIETIKINFPDANPGFDRNNYVSIEIPASEKYCRLTFTLT